MANQAQRSFGSGELAPALYARTDQAKYANGLRVCRNFLIMRGGGAQTRAGTEYVAAAVDHTNAVRLVEWIFNAAQRYVLAFGDSTLRFYRAGAAVGAGITTPYAAADVAAIQYVQSADLMTLTHPSYPTYELRRLSDISWTLTAKVYGPHIDAPTNVVAAGTAGDVPYLYFITAVDAITGEESLSGTSNTPVLVDPTKDDPHTVTWDAVTGAGSYNVYAQAPFRESTMGFVGNVTGLTFTNFGITPDFLQRVPLARLLFDAANKYPAAVGYYQQRLLLAGANATPETVYTSKSANFDNFLISTPIQDDDAVTFTLVGRQVNAVRHMLDLGRLVIFTAAGTHVIEGDQSGILTPSQVNPRKFGAHSCAALRPLEVGNSALFVQARASIVRDLSYDSVEGLKGRDLTVFASHLLEGFTVVDWAYQEQPHSIVWLVRSDGVLLGLTYMREQAVLAWHRHDTDGAVESVCVIPDGDEDRLYLVVRRTINGATKRYIERMAMREFTDIEEAFCVDSGLSYDGRDAGAAGSITMTLSGGTLWTSGETLTCTASASFFSGGMVGNAIFLHNADNDDLIRFTITAYTSPTIVTGTAHKTVPADLRSVAVTLWDYAVDEVSGLSHLEGKDVSIFADGFVVASPHNDSYTVRTVSSGAVTLDRPYALIHVGLPFTADLATLDIDTAEGPSLKEKKMLVNRVQLIVDKTRGLFAGPNVPDTDAVDDTLYDMRQRDDSMFDVQQRDGEAPDDPTAVLTGVLEIDLERGWDSNGRVAVRQVDPIPATILAAIPQGKIPRAG